MTFVAFDIETTGLTPVVDRIVEIGAVKFRSGKVMDVSKFRANDQSAKVIELPKGKSKKFVVGKIASDNKVGIKAAAKVLGDEDLVAQWEAVRLEKASSPKSPRKVSSPRKSNPAATLPMSPSGSPRAGGLALPSMPVSRVPTIGSPSRSPRL